MSEAPTKNTVKMWLPIIGLALIPIVVVSLFLSLSRIMSEYIGPDPETFDRAVLENWTKGEGLSFTVDEVIYIYMDTPTFLFIGDIHGEPYIEEMLRESTEIDLPAEEFRKAYPNRHGAVRVRQVQDRRLILVGRTSSQAEWDRAAERVQPKWNAAVAQMEGEASIADSATSAEE